MPEFHKLLLSEGNHIPITSVIFDDDGEKHKYKFEYEDTTEDFTTPGTLVPGVYGISFKNPPQERLEAAAHGIEKHTQYTVEL